jgi:putative MFS transporter
LSYQACSQKDYLWLGLQTLDRGRLARRFDPCKTKAPRWASQWASQGFLMLDPTTFQIAARLDRLPSSRVIWGYVWLLSFGGFFEIYDISLTAYIPPALTAVGIFHKGAGGLFGLNDLATFAAATFAGLWVGTLAFSALADRFGRRTAFAGSLLWYAVATVIMGLQSNAVSLDLWRLVAGVGVGVQLVAIDVYLAELVPKAMRGRAFAISASIQFLAAPICAVLALSLAPHGAWGLPGWRWLAFFPALGALGIWWVQRALPESPRWLWERGRTLEANQVLCRMEALTTAATGCPLPHLPPEEARGVDTASDRLFSGQMRGRLIMMAAFHVLQTVGFYGFSNWLPSVLEARGVNLKNSFGYSACIALAYPLAPLVFYRVADKVERKWQVVAGALGAAAFGMLFAFQSTAALWIVFGILVTVSNNLMSYGYHAYQSELFPTRVRARAVGFVYSFSRLSAVLSSYLIAFLLQTGGVVSVFVLISGALVLVAVIIGVFGPSTRGRALEAIAS